MGRLVSLLLVTIPLLYTTAQEAIGVIGGSQSGNITSFGIGQTKDISDCRSFSDCNAEYKSCYCDEVCGLYNDCCLNADTTNQTSIQLSNIVKHAKCEPVTDMKMIWIVSDCPKPQIACYDENQRFTVGNNLFVTDNMNITYRNARCALCYDISDYTYWKFSVYPKDLTKPLCNMSMHAVFQDTLNATEDLADSLSEEEGCEVKLYSPRTKSVRICYDIVEDTMGEECGNDVLPIWDKEMKHVHRNPDCCAKNGGECRRCWRYSQDQLSSLESFDFKYNFMPSYTVFDFNKKCIDGISCGMVQLFGNIFTMKVHFEYRGEELHELYISPLFCLLRKYFENLKQALHILDAKGSLWQNTKKDPFSLIALNFRLKSYAIFNSKEEMQDVEKFLDGIKFDIFVDEENFKFSMKSMDSVHFMGKQILFNNNTIDIHLRSKLFQNWFMFVPKNMENSEICKTVSSMQIVRQRRCDYLNITAFQADNGIDLDYGCVTPTEPDIQSKEVQERNGGGVWSLSALTKITFALVLWFAIKDLIL